MAENLHVGQLTVSLTRKKIKSLRLRVERDGNVQASAPLHMSKADIERFVRVKMDWIEAQRARLSKALRLDNGGYRTSGQVLIFGKRYPLVITQGGQNHVYFDGDRLFVQGKPHLTDAQFDRLIESWQRTQLKAEIEPLMKIWTSCMGVTVSGWNVKKMKTRWGSCNTAKQFIWLNFKLCQTPRACLQAILVHELTHLLIPNHSKMFYQQLDSFFPDWKTARQLLDCYLL